MKNLRRLPTVLPLVTFVLVVVCGARGAIAGKLPDVTIPPVLTLARAEALFREHGLDLLIANQKVEAAAGDEEMARAIANPSVGAGYYRSFFSKGLYESDHGWSVSVGDSNAIADALFGKRQLRGKSADAAFDAAKLDRADTERVLRLQVRQAFFQAALATEALAFAKAVAVSAGETFDLNQVRYKSGAISEVDLSKTEAAKLEADQAVDASTNALGQSKIALAFLLGRRHPSTDFEIDAEPLLLPAAPGLADLGQDELVRRAFDARPDLKSQASERARAEASLDLARRQRVPDIGLDLQYQQEGSGQTAPATPAAITPPTLLLGLTSTLPIFYQQQGEIRKARADLATQDLALARARAQVVSDVESALASFTTSRRQVARMQGRLLDRAKRARDLVELQYRKGAASLLEYLDAQRTYIATNLEYFQDLAGYWGALFQLEAAVGTEIVQ